MERYTDLLKSSVVDYVGILDVKILCFEEISTMDRKIGTTKLTSGILVTGKTKVPNTEKIVCIQQN